ncbi:MAG TPA: thioredoxin domain-containing protein [Polyangiaceae bacterium]
MNKGTAIVGFFICFFAGMFLMWGIDRNSGTGIAAEGASSADSLDHSAAAIPVTGQDPQWGNANAPVTIVEVSDFECPFCSRVGPTLKQVKDTYGPDKVRIVWKHNPLPFHKKARPAHEAAATVFALGGSDAFWKFHDLAFENQRSLDESKLAEWATTSGVDAAKFKEAYAAKKYAAKVDEDMAVARKIGASGTPAFRINGVTLSGAQPFEKFKAVIDEQLAEAQKLIGSGTKAEDVYPELVKKNYKAAEEPSSERREEPQDNTVWKVPVYDDDPVKGPKDALVTIVVWSEFQCPFCKRVEPTMTQLLNDYGKDVRLVWKDNPLPFHPRAKPAAVLALTAYKLKGDDAFWAAHGALFESQPKLEDEDLKAIAEKVGVPWATVQANLDADKFGDKLEQSMDLAVDLQARGTPHFFVNGIRLAGAQPVEKFKEIIDAQLAKAKALLAKGTPRAQVYAELMKEGKEPPPPEKKDVPAPDDTSPFKGPKTAKVVIQEFSEFECPFCKRVSPTVDQVMQEYGGKVKLVWRHLPLPFHKHATLAAEAAQEVFEQKGNDAFWKYHDLLFEAQGTPDALERANLEKLAQQVGVDMAKFKQALDSHTHKAKIEKDSEVASKAGINGTPGFVVNGYFISGAQPFAQFKKIIGRALKEAGG